MQTNQQCLIAISTLLILSSCPERQFAEGNARFISVADTTLNDSSIFVGYVYQLAEGDPDQLPILESEVWVENTSKKVFTEPLGYYSISLTPGIYQLSAQNVSNHWPQLIVRSENFTIRKDEKIRIDFYIGTTTE